MMCAHVFQPCFLQAKNLAPTLCNTWNINNSIRAELCAKVYVYLNLVLLLLFFLRLYTADTLEAQDLVNPGWETFSSLHRQLYLVDKSGSEQIHQGG